MGADAKLPAQVSLPIVRQFVKSVEEKALGVKVLKGVRPDQQLVKVVNDQLVELMGGQQEDLNDPKDGPQVCMKDNFVVAAEIDAVPVERLPKWLRESRPFSNEALPRASVDYSHRVWPLCCSGWLGLKADLALTADPQARSTCTSADTAADGQGRAQDAC